MKLSIVRSPCRVAWWVVFNGQTVGTACTKREAESIVKGFEKILGKCSLG